MVALTHRECVLTSKKWKGIRNHT